MYELLLRHISSCLVEGDMKGVKVATRIIENRLNKNTELYKEFRIFNALANSTVDSTEVAVGIMTEAKNAVSRFNRVKIEKEKSALIRDVNHKINNKSFYYRSVPNYKDLAAIHNLLEEWKKGDRSDLKKLVESEKKAINLLLTEKKEIDIAEEKRNLDVGQTDALVQKIMIEKINKKYGTLLPEQKDIIKNYALYNTTSSEESGQKFVKFLSERKDAALGVINDFELLNENAYVSKKIDPVRKKINNLDPNNLSDESIMKFLTLTKLISEIKGD